MTSAVSVALADQGKRQKESTQHWQKFFVARVAGAKHGQAATYVKTFCWSTHGQTVYYSSLLQSAGLAMAEAAPKISIVGGLLLWEMCVSDLTLLCTPCYLDTSYRQ